MKKWIVLVLALLVCLNSVPVAFAGSIESAGIITVQYVQVKSADANLSISSSGLAECKGVIKPKASGVSSSITITLQRKSGSSWVNVTSWSGTGTGLTGATASGSKTVSKGYSYRVVANGKVGTEPASAISETKTY